MLKIAATGLAALSETACRRPIDSGTGTLSVKLASFVGIFTRRGPIQGASQEGSQPTACVESIPRGSLSSTHLWSQVDENQIVIGHPPEGSHKQQNSKPPSGSIPRGSQTTVPVGSIPSREPNHMYVQRASQVGACLQHKPGHRLVRMMVSLGIPKREPHTADFQPTFREHPKEGAKPQYL